ncbi:uncharacterized protein TNCV_4134931 [Trichonephila clavipes]|nr:uncharacterized protein TNCV_4134931 [Trichonephila clavipes]
MDLCDQNLQRKCLHGKTQNYNESFNNVVWSIIPKETFVELLRLRLYIAIILFNSGFTGLLNLLQKSGLELGPEMKEYVWYLDNTTIVESMRHSKPDEKLSGKKRKSLQRSKNLKHVIQESTKYKSGEF